MGLFSCESIVKTCTLGLQDSRHLKYNWMFVHEDYCEEKSDFDEESAE